MADGGVGAMQSFVPGPDNQRALRDAFGQFATGVTVVTCSHEGRPLGMTANSFSSISLDPALVMWAPAKSSRRHNPFVAAKDFAIHVLAEDQTDLCLAIAMDGRDFAGANVFNSSRGFPVLERSLACFECRRHSSQDAGDHTIVLGEVISAQLSEGKPLLFAQGGYGRFTAAKEAPK
ncbi:MAG: flavin reductase family protein [Pseudomonadota bacterium]